MPRVIVQTTENARKAYVMTPDNLLLLSFEEFMAFIVAHFERQEYTLEERQPAPAGQLLLFQSNGVLNVVYALSNPPLPGRLWEVTAREVLWCVKTAENLKAACGYVITRSRFSFGAEKEARYAGTAIELVDGETLKLWTL
jgi:hypothetical protein